MVSFNFMNIFYMYNSKEKDKIIYFIHMILKESKCLYFSFIAGELIENVSSNNAI